jgi:phage tail sheath gpL-like
MAKNFSILVRNAGDYQPIVAATKYRTVPNIASFFEGLVGGGRVASVTLETRSDGVAASGTVTIASGTGTITATINGVGVPVTWATSDTNTAALLAAAINASANALVNQHVTATSAAGVVTITALRPDASGNAITLAASGTGATASGARLTGGSETLDITYF